MYNPPAFRIDDHDKVIAFMRRYNFATLVTPGDQGLIASHLPLMLRDGNPGEWPVLLGHFARANPQWQALDGTGEALVIFQAHAYVSPSLYEVHPSVPTWNYQVVHAYGVPELVHEPAELLSLVLDLVAQSEAGSERPWLPDLPADFMETLLKQIVGFRIRLLRVGAKFKLSQNRPAVDRLNVAAAFESSSDPVLQDLGRATRESMT